jgi:predicted ATPase
VQDTDLLLQAHHALETTLFYLGEFATAQEHMEHGLALYNPRKHRSHAWLYGGHDPGVCCLSFLSLTLWYLGYADQAMQRRHDTLTLAQELEHPNSLAHALNRSAWLSQLRGDSQAVYEPLELLRLLATEQGFAQLLAQGTTLRGWVLAVQGQGEEGITQICQGLTALRSTGAVQLQPYFLALLAEVYRIMRHPGEGLTALEEALAIIDTTGERYYEAEVHRLKGELLLAQPVPDEQQVEGYLQRALTMARRQQAKSLELRAAMSLARLWQRQDKRAEAHQLLADIYGWFTEGFDSADLRETKALLEELEG